MPDAGPTRQRSPVRTAEVADDGWRISDALWERIEPPWPPRKPLPLGDHNQRIPDRRALDTTFLVLRSACQ